MEDESQPSVIDEAQIDTELSKGFIPPSVTQRNDLTPSPFSSYTYHSPLPKSLLESPLQECILGVDEAGRGPVLGPMVYAAAYCPVTYASTLSKLSFADSKVLTPQVRSDLLRQLCDEAEEVHEYVGWSTRIMTARDISADMLSPGGYNLNAQAHDATIALIREIERCGVVITEIYVDTVGPEASYQAKLQGMFPSARVTVTKKADSKFPIVSAASVCAKVTRDTCLGREEVWGSGYPSDPRTARWLKGGGMDSVFGWESNEVRYSWGTVKELLEKNKDGVKVDWYGLRDGADSGNEMTLMGFRLPRSLEIQIHGHRQSGMDTRSLRQSFRLAESNALRCILSPLRNIIHHDTSSINAVNPLNQRQNNVFSTRELTTSPPALFLRFLHPQIYQWRTPRLIHFYPSRLPLANPDEQITLSARSNTPSRIFRYTSSATR
jgi:ribonuclease H2 subunit A